MPNVYTQITKLGNAVGRAEYITDKERQEEIVLHRKFMRHDWKEHSNFEKENKKSKAENNEAREIIIPLPNELYEDVIKLEIVCNDLVKNLIPENHDYEYAVHWNLGSTNLHTHIIFSERENQLEAEPKVYKKDFWYDKETNKLAKVGADGAELRHKKGDVQLDKDGNIKYNADIFKPKNPMFKSKDWTIRVKQKITQEVLNKYGFDFEINDKESPYLAQRKIPRGCNEEYKELASEWNEEVKIYNKAVKEHIKLEPGTEELYCEIKQELKKECGAVNAESKKLTKKAVKIVKDMSSWVREKLNKIKTELGTMMQVDILQKKWEETKEKYLKKMEENQALESINKVYNIKLNELEKLDEEIEKHIEIKENEIVNELYYEEDEDDDEWEL